MITSSSFHWPTKRLGDVATVIPGYAFKSKDWCNDGVPVIKIKNIVGDLTVDTRAADCVPHNLLTEKLRKFLLSDGDILVAMTGATAGKVGRLRCTRPHLINQRVAKLLPFAIDHDFFWAVVSSHEYQQRFYKLADGAAQPNMSGGQIENVEVPLPPRSAQRKIASVLSAYGDLIENNTRRITILEEMARSLYREWYVEFRFPGREKARFTHSPLGQIPEGWKCTSIGDLCCLMRAGGTPERKNDAYWSGGSIDWYKTKELLDCFLFGSEERITEIAATESTTRVFDPGTLLMAIYGSPTVGRMGILTKQSACNQAALAMVPDPTKASLYFLYHVLLYLRGHFNSIAAGAAQQNISKAKVETAQCVLPPLDLIQQSDLLCGSAFEEIRCLAKKTLSLRTTRDLLLPKLISGQVNVEDLDIDIGESLAEADA